MERTDAGQAVPVEVLVAKPRDNIQKINHAFARGQNVLFTPGVYSVDKTIKVKRADAVVLGLGFATLIPQDGVVPMTTADVPGRYLRADLRRRAGELARTATGRASPRPQEHPDDMTALQDVFFRIGGAAVGKAAVSLEVNSDNMILDNTWAWRADHGNGVGWTVNTADTGVVVNGDDVTAYGLFVEHFQKYEVIWNGNRGTVVFFQNEMPYDPPSQAAWMEAPGVDGWAAFKIADPVTSFSGSGMGSYSFFNQGLDIFAAHAFEVPAPCRREACTTC